VDVAHPDLEFVLHLSEDRFFRCSPSSIPLRVV
jgi:hypothetical protein